MATVAEIEQLEGKYCPSGASLGASHRADTIVTTHVNGRSYFGAIATVLDPNRFRGPGDRVYITSWKFDTSTLLFGGEPDIGERLLTLAALGVDVRLIVAVSRYSLGGAPWDDVDYYWSTAWTLSGRSPGSTSPRCGCSATRRATARRRSPSASSGTGVAASTHGTRSAPSSTARRPRSCTPSFGDLDYVPDRLVFSAHSLASAGNYWYDLGVHLRSGAAQAVLESFWTRWDETVTLPERRYWLYGAAQPFNPAVEPKPTVPGPPVAALPAVSAGSRGDVGIRIWRSCAATRATVFLLGGLDLPWDTLPPTGVAEVPTDFVAAIRAATRYIYVEDQTLNTGLLVSKAWSHHLLLYPEISAVCASRVKVVFVTQGSAGPEAPLRVEATPSMSLEIRNRFLFPLTSARRSSFALFYRRDTKVHSKLLMLDDEFVSIGSANMWDRAQEGTESEVTAALVHPVGENSLVADLRVQLWREHLRPRHGGPVYDETLRFPDISLGYCREDWLIGIPDDVPDRAIERIPDPLVDPFFPPPPGAVR